MPLLSITFPKIDPVAFHVGSLAVRWYGIAYLLGFALAYAILRQLSRRGTLRVTREALSDLIGWLVLGVLVGGRVGWWFFYHRSTGEPEPWYEPIALWHGGMSFHGGLIGVSIALVVWCWLKHAPWRNVADCAALVTPVGLFFGRIANFINAELVGRPTALLWGVVFPGETIPRHPSQLYEALLEGPILLLILWASLRTRPREGRIAALFLVVYGIFRFTSEFTRQPDAQLGFIAFGWLTMGQLLSVAILIVGLIMWISQRRSPSDLAAPCGQQQPGSGSVHFEKEFARHE